MAQEMCPICRAVRNMQVSASKRTVAMPDGRRKRVRTVSFHCESCNQFVRSEEWEEVLEGVNS
jgi:hypothetical protein